MVTDPKSPTDTEVVTAVLAGDVDRFSVLVERYQRKVFNLVVRIVRCPEQGRDVSQEAFLKAFKGLASYKSQYPFHSWLYKIAHNCALEYLRKRGRCKEVPDAGQGDCSILARTAQEAGFDSPEARMDQRAMVALVDDLMDELNPSFRATLVLRHQEEMTQQEIAKTLDVPLGTVKSRLNYAYRHLRRRLRGQGVER